MALNFTKVSADVFENLQLNAGVLLNTFNTASPAAPEDSAIICATTGGITVNAVPTFKDYGEDIDNCPKNVKELKKIDSWETSLAFTALDVTTATLKLALGAADIESGAVTPRATLDDDDFKDSIWWVGDLPDGGFVAVELKNALSTGGLSIKTTDKGKGQLSVTLTGHYSIEDQTEVPMNFFIGSIS